MLPPKIDITTPAFFDVHREPCTETVHGTRIGVPRGTFFQVRPNAGPAHVYV